MLIVPTVVIGSLAVFFIVEILIVRSLKDESPPKHLHEPYY